MAASYRFLDDVAVADVAFRAEGDSLPELFSAATEAVIDSMANPRTVGATWTRRIERRDADPAALLFDWLSDIVFWKDADGVVFSGARLVLSQEEGAWRLDGTLIGAKVNPSAQELHDDVKGVTKHLYGLAQANGRWTVTVVLDV